MAGRKRRANVARDSKGRIKATEYRREFDAGEAKWAKVRGLLHEMAADPRLSGELGRRHFLGHITASQYQAGLSYASMLDVYDWKVLGVRRSVPAFILDRVGGTDGAEQWDDAKLGEFKSRFEKVDDVLRFGEGQAIYDATRALCRGEHVADFPSASKGLEALVGLLLDRRLDDTRDMDDDAKYKVLTSPSGA